MILYFENSNEERRVIGHPKKEEEAYHMISKFLDEHDYHSYYTRTFTNAAHETVFDVGSWSEFFILSNE